ncbi:TetR family transcriptional regulator [Actinocorallia herbida]|uniref:TetR family transcriptional regulator n=1 Tax=Actinocorallia herbida TaxID=58109 RepID=A0A3N1CUN8_9ACTN|nr:TetR/AcrR family transcriptional regulator [Actinocorallia herbida]ROO84987.1 TetR family transcriptional regulator [Actinocorallia herbida]
MLRQTRQQVDDAIIDCAATLFARHGLKETSLQRIADAVGYSKSGLLRHYPSKEALQDAVLERCLAGLHQIVREVAGQDPGPERDRAALRALAELVMRRPGFVALLLSGLLHLPADCEHEVLKEHIDTLMSAFDVHPDTYDSDPNRVIRVAGALGALGVARFALQNHLTAASLDELVEVSHRALGH